MKLRNENEIYLKVFYCSLPLSSKRVCPGTLSAGQVVLEAILVNAFANSKLNFYCTYNLNSATLKFR